MTTRPSDIKRKKGTMNLAGTKKWDGTKWVPVNVARDGQRATRNGKPVIRKNGKWVPYKSSTRGYNPVSRSKSTKTKTETKPVNTTSPRASDRSYTVMGVDYDSETGKAWSPKDENGRQHTARHGYSINPKTGERTNTSKTGTKNSPSRQPASRQPASRQPASRQQPTATRSRTPQSKDMDANYKAWAKANPTLAKKVKKGQAGYKAINSSSSKAASAADAQNLRSGPTPPKRTSLKTTATKPTKPTKPATKPTKQKPLTVPTNRIPKNLTGAAGKKYLADLDAGKLTRKKK